MFSRILNLTKTSFPIFNFTKYKFSQQKKTPQIFVDPHKEQFLKQVQKKSIYLNLALTFFVFAFCFAGIPLYRTFCQHMGLTGDIQKKQYHFKDIKLNNMKKYVVKFTGQADPSINWQFQPIQKQVTVGAGQTAIVFYRLYNKSQKPVVGFSTYNISPQDCNLYFSKIQCFCFNQQLINPKQQLLLPIFFYLQPEINQDPDVSRIQYLSVAYNFIKSAKQDLAKFAEQQLKKVQQNKRKLNQIRASKMNMTLDEYLDHLDAQQALQLQKKAQQLQEQQNTNKPGNFECAVDPNSQKLQANFQQDIIKAQLISKQFQQDN